MNVLNATLFYTLKSSILVYVNFTSIYTITWNSLAGERMVRSNPVFSPISVIQDLVTLSKDILNK